MIRLVRRSRGLTIVEPRSVVEQLGDPGPDRHFRVGVMAADRVQHEDVHPHEVQAIKLLRLLTLVLPRAKPVNPRKERIEQPLAEEE